MPPSRASFTKIDYSVRPNKSVERKLIATALQHLRPEFDVPSYRYIGMGGIWFVDFVLFHRTLGVQDMISIQRGIPEARRASFNRPFRCVQVREGETTYVLQSLPLREKGVVIWLDYDSTLSGPVLDDMDILGQRLESGSVAVFTVNANYSQLNKRGKGNVERNKKEYLGSILDIPVSRIPDEAVEVDGFPAYLAGRLFDRMKSSVREASGGELSFVPLFNYLYSDNASMVTIGGMVANRKDRLRLEGSDVHKLPFVAGLDQFEIAVPLLTNKEKLAIDRLLPRSSRIPDATLDRIGCALTSNEVEAYRNFYGQYPTYAEFLL